MTFAHPELLLLLAIPVLLGAWQWTRRQHTVALPLDHANAREGVWLHRLLVAANLLPVALLAVAVLLLARPQQHAKPEDERKLTNIEFVLDVSGSMNATFGDGNRYDAAIAAIGEFTTYREGDAFGLTIFGNEVLRWTPLTKDLSVIRNAAPFLRPTDLGQHFGGTEIGKALRHTHETLRKQMLATAEDERAEGEGMIILLSDGVSADLRGTTAREIGDALAEDNIVLYAVHIGGAVAPQDLYELTRPTGGEVFAAQDTAALDSVFMRIDEMQPVELKPAAPQSVDYFEPFAIAGLSVLGCVVLASFGLRYTPW
jgi:Ca-activated chloride channel homolog